MAKRIWIVSELYYPEDSGSGYVMTGVAEGLATSHEVGVICGQASHWRRGIRALRRERRNGVDIRRCRGTTLNKDVLLLRLVNLITITVSMFFAALRHVKRDDYVLAVTTPPSSPFAIVLACRLKRARFILRIDDVYPDALFATGLMRPGSLLARVAGWFTRRLYRAAERVIVLGRDMEQLVSKRIEDNPSRIVRIPNWAELKMIVPECRRRNALLQELGLTDRFVVQYSGTMGRTHGLETIVQAAEALRSRTDIHFLFIGSGAKKDVVDQAASRLANVTVLPIRARSDLSVSLNACDVAIVSFIPGMAGISVPSRMYNIFAAGKPVIAVADSNSELALVVREEDVGWVVPPLEPGGIRNAILDAVDHPARLVEIGLRARRLAEKYSRDRIIECYATMIQNLEPTPAAPVGLRTPTV